MSSSLLEVRHLSAAWGATPVLHDVTFTAERGEFVVLMGPNGSGKTTLLRCLAGLETPTAGEVWLEDRRIDALPTHRRGIGLLFQEPALFPGRNVWENVAYGLALQRRSRQDIDRRVGEILGRLRLTSLRERPATELSGGERQRVALARSLAPEPRLVLLDEPFASVDPQLRAQLRSEFRAVLHGLGVTVVHVTHDRAEGLFLADRVLLLNEGRIVQSGRPRDVYDHPRNRTAARFLGYNVLREGGRTVAVHPGDVQLERSTSGATPGEVVASGESEHGRLVYLRGPDGGPVEALGEWGPDLTRPGTSVRITWTRSVSIDADPED
ncbi:MAG: ABC transporter ATP-binding protein [Thermoplasmata archaeon]